MNKWLTAEEIMTILTDILKKRTFCEQRNEYVIPQEVILKKITGMLEYMEETKEVKDNG